MNLIVTASAQGNHVANNVVPLLKRAVDVRAHLAVTANLTRLISNPRSVNSVEFSPVARGGSPVVNVMDTAKSLRLMRLFAPNNRAKAFRLLTKAFQMAFPTANATAFMADASATVQAKPTLRPVPLAPLAERVFRQDCLTAFRAWLCRHDETPRLLIMLAAKTLRHLQHEAALFGAGKVTEEIMSLRHSEPLRV